MRLAFFEEEETFETELRIVIFKARVSWSQESAADAQKRELEQTMRDGTSAKVSRSATADSSSISADSDGKVRQLMEMGFPRSDAEEELKKTNGDLQKALQSLLTRADQKL